MIFYPDGIGSYQTNPDHLMLSRKARGFEMIQRMFFTEVTVWGLNTRGVFPFAKRAWMFTFFWQKSNLRSLSFQVFKVLENMNSQNNQEHLELLFFFFSLKYISKSVYSLEWAWGLHSGAPFKQLQYNAMLCICALANLVMPFFPYFKSSHDICLT